MAKLDRSENDFRACRIAEQVDHLWEELAQERRERQVEAAQERMQRVAEVAELRNVHRTVADASLVEVPRLATLEEAEEESSCSPVRTGNEGDACPDQKFLPGSIDTRPLGRSLSLACQC